MAGFATVGAGNVLAPEYTDGNNGSFDHVAPGLFLPGVRDRLWPGIMDGLGVDVLGLQEVEKPLVELLKPDWQTWYTPKTNGAPDGCLLLVRHGIKVEDFQHHSFNDGSGHVWQTWRIGKVWFINTHLKFFNPAQLGQVAAILAWARRKPKVVFLADGNDWPRPGGPIMRAIAGAGFYNAWGNTHTAVVNGAGAPLDVLAARGVTLKRHRMFGARTEITTLPNRVWPSDHRFPTGRLFMP